MTTKILLSLPLPQDAEFGAELILELPLNAQVLTVRVRLLVPTLYYLADDKIKIKQERRFIVYNTGMSFEPKESFYYDHIGSFQILESQVLHLFELIHNHE